MFEWIISSSFLILVIVGLRYILKGKINLLLQYALWGVVLARLLVPVSFGGSAVSVMNAVPNDIPGAIRSLGEPESSIPEGNVPELSVPATPPDTQSVPNTAYNSVTEGTSKAIDWGQIIRNVWVGGIAAVALCLVASNLHFALKLKKTRQLLPISSCHLPVYVTEAIETPCLHGLIRPTIYVTPEATEKESILLHVLEHEATHYRHGDHIWSILRGVCLAVHWYNPLVWCAAVLSRRDSELACDESTIRRIGENARADYARTLIGMTCQKQTALFLTATTMTGSKSSIKERIILITKKPKMAIFTLVAVLLIAVVAVGCTFTGAKDAVIYDCDGLNIAIPNKYIDELIVQTGDEIDIDNAFISVYEKKSVEAAAANEIDSPGLGYLFSFVRFDQAQYEQFLCQDGSGLYFFAKDDQWYYGYLHATDVRYYRSESVYMDKTERAAWDTLNEEMGPSVRDDFIARNNLTAYSDDDARHEYTYGGEHQLLNYYPSFSVNGSKDEVYTIVLSQPARQGDGGIWCVERMLGDYGNTYLWFPNSGMPAAEYYAEVQAAHDAGEYTDYGDLYSAATLFLFESGYFDSAVIDGSLELALNLPNDLYAQDWIYELFDEGGGMSVGLVGKGDILYNTYTVDNRWYAERFDVLMSSYTWAQLDRDYPSDEQLALWTDAPYYVTLQSTDANKRYSFTFFADSSLVFYSKDGIAEWYTLTCKNDDSSDSYLASEIRSEYDNQDIDYSRIVFDHTGTANSTAELFVEELYGAYLLSLTPGGIYSIADYQAVDWGVSDVSEDEAALVGWMNYAVVPENYNSHGLWAGNTTAGDGEYEGWLVMYRQFVLQKQDDGYWHCIDIGTGGASLPE